MPPMGGLHDEDFVFLTVFAIGVSLAFQWIEPAAIGATLLLVWRLFFKPPFDTKQYRLPPRAPFGLIETIQNITTKQIITFFLRVHQKVNCNVALLNFPVPKCNYTVLVVDADLTRDILNDKSTIKAEGIVKTFERVTDGESQFFTNNGARFYHARKAIAPAFSNSQINRMNGVTREKTEEWIQLRLEPMAANGEPIDIIHEMVELTLTIIMDAAFEYTLTKEERENLLTSLDITLREFIFSNPIKTTFGFLFPSVLRARRKAKELMDLANNIIRAYRKNPNPTPGTVIDMIVRNPNYRNDNERAADIIVLIIGGHETSAASLAFFLRELAKNPSEQYILQKQLREMKEEERKDSELLRMYIRESTRLWPLSLPGPFRQVGRDFVVKSNDPSERDIMIPKGSAVFMPIICLFQNEAIFEDHERFVPSRWECPTEDMKKAWMPFALGNRNCVGQSLATCELQSILSRLCANYNFEVVEEGSEDFFLILHPVGIRLKATKI
ncbi:cytochrome P450 [Nitzschia inconspicua]|uniref:Cytochrome P450 n=1 Tax=Nitzschia inconspicua TaxID=303405 RepID=A0A9K3KFK5_9STRA|nr:cytochrome P450 [Nitzschia inconspicua]